MLLESNLFSTKPLIAAAKPQFDATKVTSKTHWDLGDMFQESEDIKLT